MYIFQSALLKLNQFVFSKAYSKAVFRKPVRVRRNMEVKCRENPVVIKLDTPEFHRIFTQEVKDLKSLFDKYEYEIRIAGGAVRDILMGQQPKDLDFATTATPDEMKVMFTKEKVRMINMAGEKHGTITPRINNKENFEITTLRIDVVTDGRHAEVEFTKDWKLDANRRDLTINSMFLGFDGSVYDYFYGYEDLQNRRVIFVGNADIRIKEDYLRIIRYFRFYGKIAKEADRHDQNTLEIIKNNAEGLQGVAGERIWTELKKMLNGNFAGSLLTYIIKLGIGKYIGIINPNAEELDCLIKRSGHLKLHPISYLAALMNDMDEVTVLHSRFKFSGYEREMAYFLVEHRGEKQDIRPLLPYQKLVLNSKIKKADIVDYVHEVLKYKGDEILLNDFKKWKIPTFPITGKMLTSLNIPPGRQLGTVLNKLKEIWIENDCKLCEKELVLFIPNILKDLEQKNKK